MRLLSKMKIKMKLSLILALAIIGCVINFLFILQSITQNRKHSNQAVNIYVSGLNYLLQADRDAYQAYSGLSNALIPYIYENKDNLKKTISFVNENIAQVKTRFDKFKNIYSKISDKNQTKFENFEKFFLQWKQNSNLVKELISKKKFKQAITTYFKKVKSNYDKMRNIMDIFTEIFEKLYKKYFNKKAIDKRYTETLIFSIILNLAILIVLLIICIPIINNVSQNLKILSKKSIEISKGDINQDIINIKNKDEIGDLSVSFNMLISGIKDKIDILNSISKGDLTNNVEINSEKDFFGKTLDDMIENLNDLILNVKTSIEQVTEGSSQIAETSQSLAQGASQQSSFIEEISEISQKLNDNAEIIYNSTVKAENASKSTLDIILISESKMQVLIDTMDEISKSSKEINKIVKIIDDMAFQINLLALNANVEAARAGKFGKGFAVVADEVRNLAVKSTIHFKEISSVVDDAIKKVGRGSEKVNELSALLEKIISNSKEAMELTQTVSDEINNQSKSIQEIRSGLINIENVTQSNSAISEETASTSEELSAQANELIKMVSIFKLKNFNNKQAAHSKSKEEITIK